MKRVKVKVTITDRVSPPGEPVVSLRVPKAGKVFFRRVAPDKSLTAEMVIPEERIQELQTMGYEVVEVKAKKAEKATEKAEKKEAS